MIAVKIGTTSWRTTDELAADEVEFTGEFLYEANGFTPAMVWDNSIQNVRAKNNADRQAEAVAAKEAEAQNAKARAQDPFQKAFIAAVAEVTGIPAASLEAKVSQYIDAQVK